LISVPGSLILVLCFCALLFVAFGDPRLAGLWLCVWSYYRVLVFKKQLLFNYFYRVFIEKPPFCTVSGAYSPIPPFGISF